MQFRSLLAPVLHLTKENLRKRMSRAIARQYEEKSKDLLHKFKDGTVPYSILLCSHML